MPRYFFHTVASSRDVDTDGLDLPNDQAATEMAVRYAGELLRDRPELVGDGETCRIEVTAKDGRIMFAFVAWALTTTGETASTSPD